MADFGLPFSPDEETEASKDERKLMDLVDEICNASTQEQRTHHAVQLRIAVDCVTDTSEPNVQSSRDTDHASERGPAVAALNRRLHRLLTSEKLSHRLASIAAFTALIHTETESIHARSQRAANAVRILFTTRVTDIATAQAAAEMVGALSGVNSALSARAVDNVLSNAVNLIGAPVSEQPNLQLSLDRARSAMVITALSDTSYAPNFPSGTQEKILKDLWVVVWDKKRVVRDQGVRGMQAVLKITFKRSNPDLIDEVMRNVMNTIRQTLSLDPSSFSGVQQPRPLPSINRTPNMCIIHGSLSMLKSLLSSEHTRQYTSAYSSELCSLSLPYQTCTDQQVREVVADILPLLVKLDSIQFASDFLDSVHTSTMRLIRDPSFPPEERGRSLVSLAAIAQEMPSHQYSRLMQDMLNACREVLCPSSEKSNMRDIPSSAVLRTISHLAKASRGDDAFATALKQDLLSEMFKADFTTELVVAVDDVGRAVPSLLDFIRSRLVHLIAATLKKRMPIVNTERASQPSIPRPIEPPVLRRVRSQASVLSRTPGSWSLSGNLGSIANQVNQSLTTPNDTYSRESGTSTDKNRVMVDDPLNFFIQVPFSEELHRIDSSAALSPKSSSADFESLAENESNQSSSSLPPLAPAITITEIDSGVSFDKENSPCVALKAIITYELTGMEAQDFTSFTNEFVIGYVESNNVKVRALAVEASAKLMDSAAKVWAESQGALGIRRLRPEVQSVLAHLLSISVADPSSDVRFVALRRFHNETFYPYILQPEMLSTLFMTFYDESLAIREAAVKLAGRLCVHNPAHVLPALRLHLMHLLTILRCDGEFFARNRREATDLIYTLTHHSENLLEPYTDSLVEALLIRLQEAKRNNDTAAALPVLRTVAELGGSMSRVDLTPYRGSLVPLIVSSVVEVQAVEASFRKAALRALAALVQNTGFVIEPYEQHQNLLPGLLDLIRTEVDQGVRIQAGILLGSLGAIDPDKHKYAALPKLGVRSMSAIDEKSLMGGSQERYYVPGDGTGAYWNNCIAFSSQWNRDTANRLQGQSSRMHLKAYESTQGSRRPVNLVQGDMRYTTRGTLGSDFPMRSMSANYYYSEQKSIPISMFSLGGSRLLEQIAGYCPAWSRESFPNDSLVGQLGHPFTAHQDYFPSVALDVLHSIIGNPRQRVQHREACRAIVNILKSVGDNCSRFLPAVVPRMLWLLSHSASNDSQSASSFTPLQQHVMQRLGDIVITSGHHFIPYTFDTVLLTWFLLNGSKRSAACVTSTCSLLSRLCRAIGDEFKPIVSTMLPPLMSAMGQDRSPEGVTTKAVLRAVETFSALLGEYSGIVLTCIMRIVNMRKTYSIREEALTTLIRVVKNITTVDVISNVVHPLIKLLVGGINTGLKSTDYTEVTLLPSSNVAAEQVVENKLGVLAASALYEIGCRSSTGFTVFIPVVAKALVFSNVRYLNPTVYRKLESFLMSRNSDVVNALLEKLATLSPQFSRSQSTQILNTAQAEAYDQGLPVGLNEQTGDVVPPRRGRSFDGQARLPPGTRMPANRVHVLEEVLKKKWEVNSNFREDDWVSWIGKIGAAMFEQSGSAAFRACVRISESYPPFTKQLFNAAFLSCWTYPQLSEDTKSKIGESLALALESATIPLNVLQAILNLFEFMDHDEKPLPSGINLRARTAYKCGAFAKAIRYKEKEYRLHTDQHPLLQSDISGETGLIAIYEKLGHIESAVGTISHYAHLAKDEEKKSWLEKLQKWDEALLHYEKCDIATDSGSESYPVSLNDINHDIYSNRSKWENILGRLRCLNQTGEWRKMNDLLRSTWSMCQGNSDALRELAMDGKGVSVAFDLGSWDDFEERVCYVDDSNWEGCFYNILLMIKRGEENPVCLKDAELYLGKARRILDQELTARVSEGYPRAYTHVVNAQILVELEETISFLRSPRIESSAFGKARLSRMWNQRLRSSKRDRNTWYRLLMTRALVIEPIYAKDQWLDFATMCRKNKLLPMASEALRMLVKPFRYEPDSNATSEPLPERLEDWSTHSIARIEDLEVRFACIKHFWAIGRKEEAFRSLDACRNEYLIDPSMSTADSDIFHGDMFHGSDLKKKRVLGSEVFSKLSKWAKRLVENDQTPGITMETSLLYAERATQIRPDWYKAWHYWGSLNSHRVECLPERAGTKSHQGNDHKKTRWHGAGSRLPGRLGQEEKLYLTQAVRGYFRAIDLHGKTRLEDSLKVLTLWFKYGGHANLHVEFDAGFASTNIAMWLEVVPQIIARLHTPFPGVERGVKSLLTRIGKEHPQVAVYPLTVAKSTLDSRQEKRRRAAGEILDEMRIDHDDIVSQAEVVARELVRVAILWTEIWYERLEEASKLYFGEQNVNGMLDTLLPLHAEMEKGPETSCEESFVAEFGEDLRKAGELCKSYREEQRRGADEAGIMRYITQAWDLYYQVFRKIQRQQQTMLALNLAKVSAGLNKQSGLVLAVPGTYDPSEGVAVVGIQSFSEQLHVIQSKQRPRKLFIMGSDGYKYNFLLKGHEDLRQDERVMQVFGLVNKLFEKSEQKAILSGVDIKRYAVIALSANAGLIEWVPDCDTMHALVKEHRETRKIMPNVEHKVMLRIAPEPDRLPLLHKVDLFEFMLQNTEGGDIAKVLWLKSRNSEMWLDRRTTYAKSLATTSMTGYLLGLGDRHPSNLMIERSTGKMMHIDFGDCFEVAMKREKYPEKVPFRLTRMLVLALEPCGVEGYFRHTCEATMGVLRQNTARESLMSMMEAFVYDPLIRWKLIGAEELHQIQDEESTNRLERQNMATSAVWTGTNSRTQANGGEVSDIVASLRETGSLSASLLRHNSNFHGNAAVELEPGAIATPQTGGNVQHDDEVTDPAELPTPNREARIARERLLRDTDPTHLRITHVSNERAELALNRFWDKLLGRDFDPNTTLRVKEQVELLIRDARNIENLCALFLGWCAFW